MSPDLFIAMTALYVAVGGLLFMVWAHLRYADVHTWWMWLLLAPIAPIWLVVAAVTILSDSWRNHHYHY